MLVLPPMLYILAALAVMVVTVASALGLRDKAAPVRLCLMLFVLWLALQLLFSASVKVLV